MPDNLMNSGEESLLTYNFKFRINSIWNTVNETLI